MCETNSAHVGMTIDFHSDFHNYGDCIIDDTKATTSGALTFFSDTWENYGNLWFSGKLTPIRPSTPLKISSKDIDNSGLISVTQSSSGGDATFYFGSSSSSSLKNSGTICANNVTVYPENTIQGNGCITLNSKATLHLADIKSHSLANQVIYMSSSTAKIYVTHQAATASLTVRGFGGGNTIGLSTGITSYTYSTSTGILQLKSTPLLSSTFTINIDTGTGYDMNHFSTSSSDTLLGKK
ncbi:hypothetical protein KAFR_0F00110 [Kazachstania africana CBS 2517]|uniref:Hyphally-regulated cell wall protein N-terminal domain-containing protein n=1 Tax=Kazachstania africana (strain ATCC 22294 / BCRC 22015 / CBS 2517 / CECT 1963 / NBRC 1671 / NRRL Y-8276) TaxID=1071382 RepID=H2AW54_KAZAF|nr:hypothetical protein KAFR_0F00110 [Kazachstania africana CBS 2517]CCF58604.1 hypothetical protein KAFR_0F00110 [Kazachstania africana CBS 2517]